MKVKICMYIYKKMFGKMKSISYKHEKDFKQQLKGNIATILYFFVKFDGVQDSAYYIHEDSFYDLT